MKDNFPRIYSLSTIGIRQHYNADYLFHPYRTDFSGDSGSGKSMVADIIQLILVGASDFKSSTDGNKQRDVKGLLATAKGRSATRGYVFLNIEMKPKKYLVIGAYIEGTSNAAELFIIQNGYDWDNLTPLDTPVLTEQLLLDNKIETLQALSEKISSVRMKAFKRKNYHRLLHINGILSLDLTNESTLKAYGSILRSFSRGKGFKTESENLKKFLFGDEQQNIIMEKYKEEVNNINNDFHEHKRYIDEIKLINEKEKILDTILAKYKLYKATFSEYITNRYQYWNSIKTSQCLVLQETQTHIADNEVEQKFVELAQLRLKVSGLKSLFEKMESLVQPTFSEEDQKKAEKRYLEASEKLTAVETMEKWYRFHGENFNDLKEWFDVQNRLKVEKAALKYFEEYLNYHGIKEKYENSGWSIDFREEISNYHQIITDMESEIKDLYSLSLFSDIANPESLLRWALDNLSFPISKVTESMLIYFQKYGKTKPMVGAQNRYVPFPEILFDDVLSKIKDEDDNGFWMDLDGVYEYIKYVGQPVLDVPNPEQIISTISNLKENADLQLKRMEDRKNDYVNLKDLLFKSGDIENYADLYSRRLKIQTESLDQQLDSFGDFTFDAMKNDIENIEQYRLEYQNAKKSYEDLSRSAREIEAIKSDIKLLQGRYFPNNYKPDAEKLKSIIDEAETECSEAETAVKNIEISPSLNISLERQHHYTQANDEIALLTKNNQIETHLGKLRAIAEKCRIDISKADDEINDGQKRNLELKLDLDFSDALSIEETNLKGLELLRERATNSLLAFEQYLLLVVGDQRFDASVSIGQMANYFLPTVFQTTAVDEDIISFHISERLHKLTQNIQEIGSRKIEILGSIFNEVYNVYSGYLSKIILIDKYLKKNEKIITGGNKASLSSKKSLYYPDSWLTNFRKQLNSHVGNIGLFSELKEELDINKMMIEAFRQLGGSSKVEPEDLMNPLSYFDLEFDLRFDDDEINSGSNGQTYAANALLCLARLSLIEDKDVDGIKVMPIDEAEGLGSNYDMLHELAKKERYQIITMAIETAGEIAEGDQYIYIMNNNKGSDSDSYVPPFGIFSDSDTVIDNITEYINSLPEDE